MTRYNYVCFKCRTVRRAVGRLQPRCPLCRNELVWIGLCPAPKASKLKEWKKLAEAYTRTPTKKHKLPAGFVRGVPVVETLLDETSEYENATNRSGKRRYKKAKLHMSRIFHGDLHG